MATKKTTETGVNSETKEMELEKALNELKKEKEELLKKVETMKGEEPKPEQEKDADYWNERIPYEAFYDGDKYADDISVKVNGERYLIQRGKQVMLPRKVVHVLENQAMQRKYSADFNRGLQEEFERETKKYIGE
jgi:hypothetical protein